MYMYIVYIHVHCSTAVCLGVFGGFITQSPPIIAGYEWRLMLLLLVGYMYIGVCSNEEADEIVLMSWSIMVHLIESWVVCQTYSLLMRANKLGSLDCLAPP